MSFSDTVRAEAAAHVSGKTNAQVAALATILVNIGRLTVEDDGTASLALRVDNRAALTKFFTLLKKTTNINFKFENSGIAALSKTDNRTLPLFDHSPEIRELGQVLDLEENGKARDTQGVVPWTLLPDDHCLRSYLRSMFVCCGSMSSPEREYRLEFACVYPVQAEQLQRILQERDLSLKTALRRGVSVVYTNNAGTIADLLTLMDVRSALLQFEDARVNREVRGSVNRQVNCETANIARTVTAAGQQLEDIRLLRESGRLASLPHSLREMASVREQYPDLPLEELGSHLVPPTGKSGVNHRLRRLREEAARLREQPAGAMNMTETSPQRDGSKEQ